MQSNNTAFTKKELARYIDHTLLKPEASPKDIEKLCKEALENNFFGVCVNSRYVPLAKKILAGSSVSVVAVIGFPLGAMATEIKCAETSYAISEGADEIDMVLCVGELKAGRLDEVAADISAVAKSCGTKKLKVILETGLLTDAEKISACQISAHAGAAFVKTCTGFSVGSATVADIALMKKSIPANVAVKASGGIKTFEQAVDLIRAGATRLGTSSGVALVQGLPSTPGSY